MVSPGRTFLYPLRQQFDLFFFQRLFFERHSFFRIVEGEPPDELTVTRIAGDDGRDTGLCSIQRILVEQETEIGISLHASMTGNAVFVDQWLYLCAEVDFILIILAGCASQKQDNAKI